MLLKFGFVIKFTWFARIHLFLDLTIILHEALKIKFFYLQQILDLEVVGNRKRDNFRAKVVIFHQKILYHELFHVDCCIELLTLLDIRYFLVDLTWGGAETAPPLENNLLVLL